MDSKQAVELCGAIWPEVKELIERQEKMMPKWISVKDKLPEHGMRVLVCQHGKFNPGIVLIAVCVIERNRVWWDFRDGSAAGESVTHWQPLLEPPIRMEAEAEK